MHIEMFLNLLGEEMKLSFECYNLDLLGLGFSTIV